MGNGFNMLHGKHIPVGATTIDDEYADESEIGYKPVSAAYFFYVTPCCLRRCRSPLTAIQNAWLVRFTIECTECSKTYKIARKIKPEIKGKDDPVDPGLHRMIVEPR